MRNIILVASAFLFFSVSAIGDGEIGSGSHKKVSWLTEEVLQQLMDLQKAVSELQDNVGNLNTKVDLLNSGKKTRPRVDGIDFGRGVLLGAPNAPFAIVEFMDYQCPFCVRHASKVLPQIKKELIDTGKVKYVIRDFPLSSHSQAKGAAIAVTCAGEQGKYWQMHEQFVANSRKLNDDYYGQAANDLGLDVKVFKNCLVKPEHEIRINESLAYGEEVGVTGTPKFFVGRVKGASIGDVQVISGAQPFGVFSRAVEKLSGTKVVPN